MKLVNRLLHVLLGIAAIGGALAQSGAELRVFTLQKTLSFGAVYDMIQDRQGFLWTATENGLHRFDGYEFSTFTHDPFDSTSLAINSTNQVLEDADGTLWIATWGGGLNRFSPRTEKFVRYRHEAGNASSLSDDHVQILCLDKNGTLWVGTYDGGLNRFDRAKNNFTVYKNDSARPASLGSDRVWSIASLDGQLWIGTGKTLDCAQLSDPALSFKHYSLPMIGSAPNVPRYLLADSAKLWIGAQHGIYCLNAGTEKMAQLWADDPVMKSVTITRLHKDRHGFLWIGTIDQGLFDWNPSMLKPVRHPAIGDQSGDALDVRALVEDRSDNVWIGTRGGSLYKADLKPVKFKALHSTLLSSVRTNAILPDIDNPGTIWIGTDKGLGLYDGKDFHYLPLGSNKSSVRALLQEGSILWIGTIEGVVIYDTHSGKSQRLTHNPDDLKSLSDNIIRTIVRQKDGKYIWIGTLSGLDRYDPSTKEFTHYRHRDDNASSLSHGEVRAVLESQNGELWIGTFGGGLNRLDTDRGIFMRYLCDPKDPTSLGSNDILCLLEDSNSLWIGTDGYGLNRMDLASGKFEHFMTRDGLPHNRICAILKCAPGVFWLATSNGLCRIITTNGRPEFHAYDKRDGLASDIFLQQSAARGMDGDMYFGGTGGVTRFNPEDAAGNPFPPSVIITRYRLFRVNTIEDHPIYDQEGITVSPKEDYFSLKFVGLEFTNSEKNLYAYRLDGFEKEWIYCGDRKTTSYSGLEPGHYVFRVKAANNDGKWNEQGASISITVLPPLWKMWWFRVLILAAFVLVLWGVHGFRVRHLESQHRLLEEEVRKRTRELEAKTDELKELNDQKNELLGLATHDLRNTLSIITGYTDLAISAQPPSDIAEDLQKVSDASLHMQTIITDVLDISAIESGKVNLELRSENWINILEEREKLHARIAAQKNIALTLEKMASPVEVTVDRYKMVEVVDNLVTNAIKYTHPGGSIRIYCERRNGDIVTHVEDTGQGLDEKDLREAFTHFKKLSARPTGGESSTGLGLAIVKKLVELHGGRVWVTSQKNKGSVFSFTVPVAK